MVELKVTLNNCKKPNDVYNSLKTIIEEYIYLNQIQR